MQTYFSQLLNFSPPQKKNWEQIAANSQPTVIQSEQRTFFNQDHDDNCGMNFLPFTWLALPLLPKVVAQATSKQGAAGGTAYFRLLLLSATYNNSVLTELLNVCDVAAAAADEAGFSLALYSRFYAQFTNYSATTASDIRPGVGAMISQLPTSAPVSDAVLEHFANALPATKATSHEPLTEAQTQQVLRFLLANLLAAGLLVQSATLESTAPKSNLLSAFQYRRAA